MAKSAPLATRVCEFLRTTPNNMASDWEIMWNLYPEARQADKGNGARIANIRKLAYKKTHGFCISSYNADMIYLLDPKS